VDVKWKVAILLMPSKMAISKLPNEKKVGKKRLRCCIQKERYGCLSTNIVIYLAILKS
jgi:hypothetical protein